MFVLSCEWENFLLTLTLSAKFEKRVLRIMFRNLITQELRRPLEVNPINFFRLSSTIKERNSGGRNRWLAWERRQIFTKFKLISLEQRDCSGGGGRKYGSERQ